MCATVRGILLTLIASLYAGLALAEEVEPFKPLLCVMDAATGFKFENGKWKSTNFNVDDEKYVLRKGDPEDDLYFEDKPIGMTRIGSELTYTFCPLPENVRMTCYGISGGEAWINTKTMKFIYTYPAGYLSSNPDHATSDTPHIGLGKCSQI